MRCQHFDSLLQACACTFTRNGLQSVYRASNLPSVLWFVSRRDRASAGHGAESLSKYLILRAYIVSKGLVLQYCLGHRLFLTQASFSMLSSLSKARCDTFTNSTELLTWCPKLLRSPNMLCYPGSNSTAPCLNMRVIGDPALHHPAWQLNMKMSCDQIYE